MDIDYIIKNNIYFNNLVRVLNKENVDSPERISLFAKGTKKCLDECIKEIDYEINYQYLINLRKENEYVNSVLEALYDIKDVRYLDARQLYFLRENLNSLCKTVLQISENPQNIDTIENIEKVQISLSKVGEMWHERLREEYPHA